MLGMKLLEQICLPEVRPSLSGTVAGGGEGAEAPRAAGCSGTAQRGSPVGCQEGERDGRVLWKGVVASLNISHSEFPDVEYTLH